MKLKTLPIFMAFLVMGVADAMGPLSNAVKEQYELSNVMATLLSFFVFIAFAAFSVPGGLLAARIGMKKLLLLGLGLNAAAMLVPSVMVPGFGVLLVCIFVLGIGTTFLQVAGNPIMRVVSAEGNYSRNLSFAQGIKGLGFVCFIKVEESKPEVPPSIASSLKLLKEPVFALAVLGIFLYVGAEASMGRFLFPGLLDMGMEEATASKFGAAMFFLLLTIGRIAGGALLTKVQPRPAFRISALMGAVGAGLLMFGNTSLAIAGVILSGLGFANIWPLLFSITVEEKPERAGELSGLMCMAISGGAIVPLLMGGLVDAGMKSLAFVIPVLCFVYLFVLSLKGGTKAAA
jgi:FHS family L-fucose permease-like MFS transporter